MNRITRATSCALFVGVLIVAAGFAPKENAETVTVHSVHVQCGADGVVLTPHQIDVEPGDVV